MLTKNKVALDEGIKVNRPYLASMIGTTLEYYDCSLYGFMTPILAPIFLPSLNRVDALILAFMTYLLGTLSRPLGGIVLGRVGDKWGRKKALIISITGTAVVTGLIGCLPTYAMIGVGSPLMLVFLIMLQKFFQAGEYNGGAIFLLEHAKNSKGFWSGLYCGFTVIGIFAASIVSTVIAYLPEGFWRLAYILGFLTAIFGIYLRKQTTESPEFESHRERKRFKDNLIDYKWQILWSIGSAGFFSALYQIPTVFMNAFVPLVSEISTGQILVINTYALALYMIALPVFGALADRITIKKSMFLASMTTIVLSYPLFLLLKTNSLFFITIMKMSFALLAAWFVAPFHIWIQNLYRVRSRYQMISISYSIGSQLGGATPALALLIWKHTSITQIPALFIILWGSLGALAILKAKQPLDEVRIK